MERSERKYLETNVPAAVETGRAGSETDWADYVPAWLMRKAETRSGGFKPCRARPEPPGSEERPPLSAQREEMACYVMERPTQQFG